MKTHEAISKRIRELCYEQRVSTSSLSAVSGVSIATIKSIFSGESRNPGILTIHRLCIGLGITVKDFFNSPEFDELDPDE